MSTSRRLLPILLLVGIAVHPSLARADEHEIGWVFGASFGAGTGNADESGFVGGRSTGFGADARLGYVLAPRFDAGVEAATWSKGAFSHDVWALQVWAASVTWFPRGSGPYLKAGTGLALIRHSLDAGSSTIKHSERGLGVILGTGYEWSLGRKMTVGPQVDFGYGRIRDGLSMNFTNLTATAKWYF